MWRRTLWFFWPRSNLCDLWPSTCRRWLFRPFILCLSALSELYGVVSVRTLSPFNPLYLLLHTSGESLRGRRLHHQKALFNGSNVSINTNVFCYKFYLIFISLFDIFLNLSWETIMEDTDIRQQKLENQVIKKNLQQTVNSATANCCAVKTICCCLQRQGKRNVSHNISHNCVYLCIRTKCLLYFWSHCFDLCATESCCHKETAKEKSRQSDGGGKSGHKAKEKTENQIGRDASVNQPFPQQHLPDRWVRTVRAGVSILSSGGAFTK